MMDQYKYLLIIFLCFALYYIFIIYQKKSISNFNNISTINNSIYTAIIIEPRKHKALQYVLENFTSLLDNKWNFIIFHGNKNKEYIKNIIKNINQNNRIKLINLNIDNLSIHDYNTLLYNKKFYDYIPTEIFLIFQTDTYICKSYKHYIDEYLEYDYVGAPWKDGKVGNGGLSLRRKSKMLEIIDKCGDRKYYSPGKLHNEDAFFSELCNDKVHLKKPSYKDAKKFSIETVYNDESFGIHKCWNYIDKENMININKFCPGLDYLVELNK